VLSYITAVLDSNEVSIVLLCYFTKVEFFLPFFGHFLSGYFFLSRFVSYFFELFFYFLVKSSFYSNNVNILQLFAIQFLNYVFYFVIFFYVFNFNFTGWAKNDPTCFC